jgi:hypothetical protein
MRRRVAGFYREFHEYRQAFGATEYDVEDLIKGAVSILRRYLDEEDELLIDALRTINDGIEARENDPLQGDLFAHEAHAALGERRRIKRGRMTSDQALRRKFVIDRNKADQDKAWAVETGWLNDTIVALRGYSPSTVREDVLDEDGTVKILEPEPA